ncbi:hypothetical protein NQ317_001709 [Molorchus minor]|uniref:Mediator complex subunit 1 n=1 Tax=Molorchus minor TaxID=1323400 RepID=A0ABQ9J3Q4_9CUCU|nr:hypothetical protein NQ317_001709 [Molorchus minor]
MKSNLKPGSGSHQSPKHSPAHVPSSPKHIMPGISSPKHHGTSPKHPSASGSGKPSMSTLKNAANSPSSKGSSDSKSKSSSKESSRDKDKKLANVFNMSNSKTKSSSVKVKPLDLNAGEVMQDGLPSPSSTGDSSKSSQVRNRKGSLSAIVDKLKVNAQHCDTATDLSSKTSSSRERSSTGTSKTSESKSSTKTGETKNSDKDSSSNKSSSSASLSKSASTGSPKSHTGLKPGVNSGPASKKPQQLQKSSSNITNSTASANYSVKSSSSGNKTLSSSAKVSSSSSTLSKSISKSSGSPKTSSSATDLSRTKDRLKPNKTCSEKSIFSSLKDRKSSPTPNREESDTAYRLSQTKMDPYASPIMMEGMIKQLDKNFQIPKLSARVSDDKKNQKNDSLNNVNRCTVEAKLFDMMAKNDISTTRYPVAIPGPKMFENMNEKLRNNNLNPLALSNSPKLKDEEDDKKRDLPQNLSSSQGKESFTASTVSSEPLSLSTKSIDLTSKFVAPAPKDDRKESKKSDNDVLDFSGKSAVQAFPQSPSVSVHIVKSPSPLINPSPHSASPCITDDELMDEALIGLGK